MRSVRENRRTRYLQFFIPIVSLLFLISCSDEKGAGNEASITLSLVGSQSLSSHRAANDNRAIFESFSNITISILDNTGVEYSSVNWKNLNSSLTLAVPSGIALEIQGMAYQDDVLIYSGITPIPPLKGGVTTTIPLQLQPVGILTARMLSQPVQVDISEDDQPGDNRSVWALFTGDNRQVAFYSQASNLVAGDNNGNGDFFIKDLVTETITNVHVSSDGSPANAGVLTGDMDSSGTLMVFASDASNLVPGDTNGVSDVFLHDRANNATERLSLNQSAQEMAGASRYPSISADGRLVAFSSDAPLTGGDSVGVFLQQRIEAGNTLQYVGTGNYPRLSGDGAWLIYQETPGRDLVLFDIAAETSRVIVAYAESEIGQHRITHDGRYLVFATRNSFTSRDTDAQSDIYRFDRVNNELVLLSMDRQDISLTGEATEPALSNDGVFVVFAIGSVIYVKDVQSGELATITNAGSDAFISGDGELVGYSREDDGHLFVVANPLRLAASPDSPPLAPPAFPAPGGNPEPIPELSLNISKSGNGGGSVTSSDALIDCGSDCSQTYEVETMVTLTAHPGEGSRFIAWGGNCAGQQLETEVVVSGITGCTATFQLQVPLYRVGGSVNGLSGQGLVLQNNNGDNLPLNGNGVFYFTTELENSNTYSVTILSQPAMPNQICTVSNGIGAVAGADINSIAVNCVTSTYTISGNVSGLLGIGLVLQNNGGDNLPLNADGDFTFSQPVTDGGAYNVTVLTAPQGPNQVCNIANGGGILAGADITNVGISCVSTTSTYTVGGSVTGLLGSGLVLQNNGSNNLSVSADGVFTFTIPLADTSAYSVSVLTSPSAPSQSCVVSNGSGTLSGADITNVSINCSTNNFTVGGQVSGLLGGGLVLQNNNGDNLPISTNGGFVFASALADTSAYSVTVFAQPTIPQQICSVTGGVGVLSGANVTDINITCVTQTYSVGGTVSGLVGAGLILKNNGADNLPVSANGVFTFVTAIADGAAYSVTVATQPGSPAQTCTVTNGSGIVNSANVTGVTVNCVSNSYTISGTVTGLAGTGMILRNNGVDDLLVNSNGGFTFATPIADGGGYSVSVATQPSVPNQICAVSSGSGTVAGANIANVSIACTTVSYTVEFTVSGLAGNGLVVSNGGESLNISINGPYMFVIPVDDGQLYNVTVTTQPTAPNQECTVTNGAGTVSGANVTNVGVNCVTIATNFSVGGNVSGITGTSGVILQNSAADNISVTTDGVFTFPTLLPTGTAYAVTVLTPPAGRECSVLAGSGTVTGGNISNVSVLCIPKLVVSVSSLPGQAILSWTNTGAPSYDFYGSSVPNCDIANYTLCPQGQKVLNVASSFVLSGLTNGQGYYFYIVANHTGGHEFVSQEAGARPDQLAFDNSVFAIAPDASGNVYVGGDFFQVGARSGGGVAINAVKNYPEYFDYAMVAGTVTAAAADGNGGYFIAGLFNAVGGQPRNNIAHVMADGSVDLNWDPGATSGIGVLKVSGGLVYAGGNFTNIGGQSRAGLAAINASTGVVTPWNPASNGQVIDLAISAAGDVVYVGGSFTAIGASARQYIAAIDATTGLATDWDPGANATVYALTGDGNTLYVGGSFTTIGSGNHTRLAAIDISPGSTGLATAWNPSVSGIVRAIEIFGNTIYIGGNFITVGADTRTYLAAVDKTTGLATSWSPNPETTVSSLTQLGDTLYAGGGFGTMNGVARKRLASFNMVTGELTDWDPGANAFVDTMAASGTSVFVGGQFTSMGKTVTRSRLAKLDANGQLTDWMPGANNRVSEILVDGTTIYVGGSFTTIDGTGRNRIAALDATTGGLTSWNPGADNGVYTMALGGTRLFVGGSFRNIGGMPRNRLASFDRTTGAITTWNPNANNRVNALATDGTTVYAGGNFSAIGVTPSSRFGLAALNPNNGSLLTWDSGGAINNRIDVLLLNGTTLYAGGAFTSIGGLPRNYLAALNTTVNFSTALANWNPSPNSLVGALALSGNTLYTGGGFSTIGGSTQNRITSLNAGTGGVIPWGGVGTDASVSEIAVSGGTVYIGGSFKSFNGHPAGYFAAQ